MRGSSLAETNPVCEAEQMKNILQVWELRWESEDTGELGSKKSQRTKKFGAGKDSKILLFNLQQKTTDCGP